MPTIAAYDVLPSMDNSNITTISNNNKQQQRQSRKKPIIKYTWLPQNKSYIRACCSYDNKNGLILCAGGAATKKTMSHPIAIVWNILY